jgi:hypothetical protein
MSFTHYRAPEEINDVFIKATFTSLTVQRLQ